MLGTTTVHAYNNHNKNEQINNKTMTGTEKNLFLTCADKLPLLNKLETYTQTQIKYFILLHEKFLQFDSLRAVVFQLNLKYLHVKITKPFAGSSINK